MSQSLSNKTILQIIPSLEAGGAERATIDIAAALVKEGACALVISSGGRLVDELVRNGAAHFLWPVHSKNPLVIMRNAARLARFIHEQKVDVVHVRSRAPAWSAFMATRKAHTPFIATFHAAYKGRSPLKKLYNSVMARADAVIAISDFIARHIRQHYGALAKNIITIPRGIDVKAYHPDSIRVERKEALLRSWKIPQGKRVIIMPGRLSPIKGHVLVLNALAQLGGHEDFVCVFIGPVQGRDGYVQELHAQIEALSLGDRVRFVEGVDMPAAYAVADLVLSPSQVAEGFGRVPVEAQAAGVPVIATALGATEETIRHGETGWLVPQGDEVALALAIETALALSPEARVVWREKAMANAARFTVEAMCAATLKVYEEVLAHAS